MPNLPEVAGDRLTCSLAEFEHRCRLLLAEEQEKIAPDNRLIGLLCEAVRVGRENQRLATAPIAQWAQQPAPAADAEVSDAEMLDWLNKQDEDWYRENSWRLSAYHIRPTIRAAMRAESEASR